MKTTKTAKSFLAIIYLLTSVTGCISDQTNKNVIEINTKNVENVDNLNLSKLADSCVYVKLETGKECLIGTIEDLHFFDNRIFIQNYVNGDDEVLVFDKSGSFLNRIGTEGEGPGEYLSIAAMGINHFEKQVVLFDPYNEKIHKYDYSGNFLESLPVKEECTFINKVRFISKNRIQCVYSVNFSSSTLVSESDVDLGEMKVLSGTNFTYQGGFKYAHNPITYNGNYYIKPLSDTIYNMKEGALIAAYYVNLNNTKHPDDQNKDGGDFEKLFLGAIKNGYSFLDCIAECKNYLLIRQFGYTILWDIKSNKGLNLSHEQSGLPEDFIPIKNVSNLSGFDGGLIVAYSIEMLMQIKNNYQNKNAKPTDRIENFLKDLDENDNPYLCIYYHNS